MLNLFTTIYPHVSALMDTNDGSHNMTHIKRVIRTAERILEREQTLHLEKHYDTTLVQCGALLHDVGDKKYTAPGRYGLKDTMHET
jgi:uncharacterized protein